MEYQRVQYYVNKGITGLKNIGNTCYLNSSIQALSNTLPLTHYILSDKWKSEVTEQNKKRHEYYILSNYIRLLVELWNPESSYKESNGQFKNSVLVPRTLKSNLEVFVKKYVGYDQQDAHECLTYLLEFLHKSLSREIQMNMKEGDYPEDIQKGVERWKNLYEKDYSQIIELFYGELQGVTTCKECNYSSKIYDPFSTLTLNLQQTLTLQNLLNNYLGEKDITDWKCEKCNKITECNHETNIISMPPILVIHLKRFKVVFSKQNDGKTKSSLGQKRTIKNNDEVEYNLEETIYGRKYKLYSVIHHTGDLNGGHYVNTSKNMSGDWNLYNDGSVTKVDQSQVLNKRTGYILFYEKTI